MNNQKIAETLPKHFAIIMDGNGRWAEEKGLKRTAGHKEGAKAVNNITRHCASLGIEYLTLYAFSTENWNRPKLEVDYLMKLLEEYLTKELITYQENNICFDTIGDMSRFPSKLQSKIAEVKDKTKNNTRMVQILALNYGAKDEIVRATREVVKNNLELNEVNINNHLDTKRFPDVDLLLRTGGEIRVSNFLLWQCAYSEMYFTQTLWPEFTIYELDEVLNNFSKRNRRFGGV